MYDDTLTSERPGPRSHPLSNTSHTQRVTDKPWTKTEQTKVGLTISSDQDLLLAHVLDVDGAVNYVFWRRAVLLHLLALVTLDLEGVN